MDEFELAGAFIAWAETVSDDKTDDTAPIDLWREAFEAGAQAALENLHSRGLAVVSANALRDEARACWDLINAKIDPDQRTDGSDAQRAYQCGLTTACNLIFDRAYWDRDKPQVGGGT